MKYIHALFLILKKYKGVITLGIILSILLVGIVFQSFIIFNLNKELTLLKESTKKYEIKNDEFLNKKLIPALKSMESNTSSRLDEIENRITDIE